MKKVSRMLLFASVSLYLTALWNKGFTLPPNLILFAETVFLLTFTSYLVVPLSKAILFPLHFLTFGFLSIGCYLVLFYLIGGNNGLVNIKPWIFPGVNVAGISIQKITFSYMGNLIAVSISTSIIINMLEKIT